jgi:List-Bact-rpt repeat protein
VSHVRGKKIVVLLTILALVLGMAGVADAKKKRKKKQNTVPTTLIIESAEGSRIAGTVESTKSGCIDSRKITLSKNGEQLTPVESDTEGFWETQIHEDVVAGDVILAKTEKADVKSKKKVIHCGTDSDRFVVGDETHSGGGPGTSGGATSGVRTLLVQVSNGGSVSSSPAGIEDCSNDTCSANYLTGTNVTLTASPKSNWQLAAYTGCDTASGNTCAVTMDTNRTVTATFECAGSDPVNLLICTLTDLLS